MSFSKNFILAVVGLSFFVAAHGAEQMPVTLHHLFVGQFELLVPSGITVAELKEAIKRDGRGPAYLRTGPYFVINQGRYLAEGDRIGTTWRERALVLSPFPEVPS